MRKDYGHLPVLLALLMSLLLLPARTAVAQVQIKITSPMPAPRWAQLERQLLAENAPACREFFGKYFDDRGYLQCVVRWGANDGPDDAFENFNRWPELHALGGADEILAMYRKGHDGLIRQYTEAKTVETPAGREGMYYREFITQSDWMHHGEGLQLFNRMGLSIPTDPTFIERARRFAGFYTGEDPEAPNYDPEHKIIRSMLNGSRGPMLRKATAIDWVGDPFDVTGFVTVHRERTFQEFLDHYVEYSDVVGDHFLNLVATTLPTTAFMATGDAKYRQWLVSYMDAWLDRMKQNGGIIPSFVDLDGRIGGAEGKWWLNAYGWGFSPLNPTNGRRENRNRIPRAVVGFGNAMLVTGDQRYADAWRAMIDAINSHARAGANGQMQYPSMYGADGWYGWSNARWSVGATDLWYWSMKPQDLQRLNQGGWIGFLNGRNPEYPEQALQRDLDSIQRKLTAMRRDTTPKEKRLADNMLDYNPAATASLVQLMWGGLPPGIDGGLIHARVRYFDPSTRRAGIPEDVAAMVSELTDTRTVVTLVNLNPSAARTVIVQAGAYGEHQFESVSVNGISTPVNAPLLTVELAPGAGEQLTLAMKRYANPPTLKHPWHH
jgi:hypothetical protein